MLRHLPVLLLFAGCELLPSDTPEPELTTLPEATAASLTLALRATLGAYPDTPGVVVAVQTEEGIYVEGFGVRTLGGPDLRRDAIFDIGSVHKNFKWAVMHTLVDDGLLDLDAPVQPWAGSHQLLDGVLVRHLFQHSAGLPDIPHCTEFSDALEADLTRVWTDDEILAALDSCSGTVTIGTDQYELWTIDAGQLEGFRPGIDASYSSFGPVLGKAIVEDATGQSLIEAMRERVLDPLDLQDTSFVAFEPDPDRLVEAYWSQGVLAEGITTAEQASSFSSANGIAMYSSAHDLVRYVHAQLAGDELFDPETRAALTSDPLQAPGRKMGLGVIQDDAPSVAWWGHTGDAIHGHSAAMLHDVASGTSVVVLSNLRNADGEFAPHYALAEAALEIVAP